MVISQADYQIMEPSRADHTIMCSFNIISTLKYPDGLKIRGKTLKGVCILVKILLTELELTVYLQLG